MRTSRPSGEQLGTLAGKGLCTPLRAIAASVCAVSPCLGALAALGIATYSDFWIVKIVSFIIGGAVPLALWAQQLEADQVVSTYLYGKVVIVDNRCHESARVTIQNVNFLGQPEAVQYWD